MPFIRQVYRSIYADSLPPRYFDQALSESHVEFALFAGGCFWGVEQCFREEFIGDAGEARGILDLRCVYAGDPQHAHPLDTHLGNHAESVLIKFDKSLLSYEDLVVHFFRIHDPTQKNAQGNDRGRRYRSCIWTFSSQQDRIAKEVRNRVSLHYKTQVDGSLCATKILQADLASIWTAERRHQRYLQRHPSGYHCHSHYKRTHILGESIQQGQPCTHTTAL